MIWHLVKKHNCLKDLIPPHEDDEVKEKTRKVQPIEMESVEVPEMQTKMFRCNFCKRIFDRYSSLRIHLGTTHYKESLKQHYGENEWECKHCHKNFVSERQLLCHLSTLHNGVYFLEFFRADYEIDINQDGAKQPFKSLKVARGLSRELFRCPKCGVTRKKFSSLKVHIANEHHYDKISPMYGSKKSICGLCDKELTTERNLIHHLLSSHQSLSEFMPRKDSTKVTKLASSQALKKKKSSRASKNTLKLGETLSNKSTENLSSKKPCPSLVKKKKRKAHRCQICNVKRSSIQNTQRHMALIHFKSELKKMFVKNERDCRVCSKTFVDDAQLLEHIANVHNGLKDFLPVKK